MTAVFTSYAGKAIVRDAAIEVAIDNLPYIGSKKAILLGKALIMHLLQRLKVILNTLIIL